VDSRKKDVANIITQDEATNSPAKTEHEHVASSMSINLLSLLLNVRLQDFNRRAIGRVKYVAERIMLATNPVNIMASSAPVEPNSKKSRVDNERTWSKGRSTMAIVNRNASLLTITDATCGLKE
jgi:hypothetical protein